MKIKEIVLIALIVSMPALAHEVDNNDVEFEVRHTTLKHHKKLAWEFVPIIRDRGFKCDKVTRVYSPIFRSGHVIICNQTRYKYLIKRDDDLLYIKLIERK